jgi:hypothetical protein
MKNNLLGERVLKMEDRQVFFEMIADMVKKHNNEKADLT